MKVLVLIFSLVFSILGCYDDITDYEELCYSGEKKGCILYDGGCYDGSEELFDVKYDRCCDGKYVYFIYDGTKYYSRDDMYSDICEE